MPKHLRLFATCAALTLALHTASSEPNAARTAAVAEIPSSPSPILAKGLVLPLYPPNSSRLDSKRVREPERYTYAANDTNRIRRIVDIHNPSIEVHRAPQGSNSGSAIILAPGGGHRFLSAGAEGADCVPFFASHGITTIILRYRLQADGYDIQGDAVNDALQAVRLTRLHAADWGLDPKRIGVMGFSAGAELASCAALYFHEFDDRSKDSDSLFPVISARPDFVALIYPGPSPFTDQPNTPIPDAMPPSFIASAGSGDRVHALWADDYFSPLLRAGVPNLEMHIYGRGKHAGGLSNRNGIPFGTWQHRFVDWFADLGFLQTAGQPTQAEIDSRAWTDIRSRETH